MKRGSFDEQSNSKPFFSSRFFHGSAKFLSRDQNLLLQDGKKDKSRRTHWSMLSSASKMRPEISFLGADEGTRMVNKPESAKGEVPPTEV
jgi:hypothetical protein